MRNAGQNRITLDGLQNLAVLNGRIEVLGHQSRSQPEEKTENGALVWEFAGSKLNQRIRAISQKFYFERLLIVLFLILVVVALLYRFGAWRHLNHSLPATVVVRG